MTSGSWTLTPYQEEGVAWLMRTRRGILADGVGLGKTVQVVSAWQRLAAERRGGGLRLMVVCPKKVTTSWREHAGDASRGVVVTYYKALPLREQAGGWGPYVLVLDEAHVMRTTQSALWRKVRAWVDAAERTWITDGTPAYNRGENLRALCRMLDLPVRATLDGTLSALRAGGLFLRRTRDEVSAALPSLRQVAQWVQPTQSMQERWRAAPTWAGVRQNAGLDKARLLADRGFLARVGLLRGESTAGDAPTAASSPLICPPAVVWCHHVDVARLAAETLARVGLRTALVTGRTQKADREIARWQAEGGVLVATHCLGAGVQLQAASLTVFLELPYDTRAVEQALARMYRTGQTRETSCVYVLWRHMVDDHVRRRLLEKDSELSKSGL